MLNNRRIMTVLAHPDDETLGCGGALHRFGGENVLLLIPVRRIEEQFEQAIKHLGIKNYIFGNFEDNSLDKYPLMDICKFVEDGIKKFKPDVIITHHSNCTNQDHRLLYQASCIATRPARNKIDLLTCEVLSSTGYLRPCNFEPNYYISLDCVDLEAKVHALNEYKTEERMDRSDILVNALARLRGAECGETYAEGFMLVRGYE